MQRKRSQAQTTNKATSGHQISNPLESSLGYSALNLSASGQSQIFNASSSNDDPRNSAASNEAMIEQNAQRRDKDESFADSIRIGTLLEFYAFGTKRRVGRAVKPQTRRRWLILDGDGVESSVPEWKVTFIIAHLPEALEIGRDIKSVETACINKANEINVSITSTWQAILNSPKANGVTAADFAFIVFGYVTPVAKYTAHLVLSNDSSIYFVKKKRGKRDSPTDPDRYIPRSSEQCSQIMKDKKDEAKWSAIRQSFQDRDLTHLEKVMPKSEVDLLVQSLEVIAMDLEADGCSDRKYCSIFGSAFQKLETRRQGVVCEVMTSLHFPLCPSSAFEILVAWGIFSRHENIAMRKAGLRDWWKSDERFEDVVDGMLNDKIPDEDSSNRVDMKRLRPVAIDKSGTKDVDDAISWDKIIKIIYVHVADPTRFFSRGPSYSILIEAARRGETMHLPYSRLSMFPEELATNLFSLTGRKFDGSSLTISFQIMEDGSIGDDMSIQPSVIRKPLQLSYDKANKKIKSNMRTQIDVDLKTLHKLASKRRNYREARSSGAFRRNRQANIRVTNEHSSNPDIRVEIVEDSDAHLLVSELMITANTVAASLARRLKIPIPYRGLKRSRQAKTVEAGSSIGRYPGNDKGAGKIELSTRPAVHSYLGLPEYTTVTSPIRRYVDLLAHFQIKAALRGVVPPYSETKLRNELEKLSAIIAIHRGVESRTKKYWQFEYLRQLGPAAVHEGVYLPYNGSGKGVVYLTNVGLEVETDVPPGVEPHMPVETRVKKVNPRTENVVFSAIEFRSEKRRKLDGGESLDVRAFAQALSIF